MSINVAAISSRLRIYRKTKKEKKNWKNIEKFEGNNPDSKILTNAACKQLQTISIVRESWLRSKIDDRNEVRENGTTKRNRFLKPSTTFKIYIAIYEEKKRIKIEKERRGRSQRETLARIHSVFLNSSPIRAIYPTYPDTNYRSFFFWWKIICGERDGRRGGGGGGRRVISVSITHK